MENAGTLFCLRAEVRENVSSGFVNSKSIKMPVRRKSTLGSVDLLTCLDNQLLTTYCLQLTVFPAGPTFPLNSPPKKAVPNRNRNHNP